MQGALYESDFGVISAYANDKEFNAIELLGFCQRLKDEFTKN